ncbi:MAG: DNA polymerase I [Clostridia bacterium]|nr:DNA polymerase I [Clostridia bacterium]
MKKLLVIDGNSILNRAFYGIRLLTNKDGLYTNAIYGMATIIERHISHLAPDYCAVAFDLKAPTFRHKMYDGYKAQRKGMPEELAVQLPYAKKCMADMGCRVISLEGYEADDILGTLVSRAEEKGVAAYILTGDRDSLQLISDTTRVLLAKTKETLDTGRSEFKETYGIDPEQFVDVKALMGDSSDNIPGVAGIGEKTALKLISEFGGLDALYEKLDEAKLSPSVKQKLSDGRDMAYLSRTLARINCEAPIEETLEDCAYNGMNKVELYKLFVELDFLALIKKFDLEGVSVDEKSIETAHSQITETAQGSVCEIAEKLMGKKIALSLSADGSIAVFDGEHRYICPDSTAEQINKIIGKCDVACHDSKKIYKFLLDNRVDPAQVSFDTMLAAYVIDSTQGDFSLPKLALSYLGSTLDESYTEEMAVFDLRSALDEKIDEIKSHALLCDIELPLARVLAEMEKVGFRIDVDGVCEYGEVLSRMAEDLKERIYAYAGEEFNIGSPKQLGEVLFEKMMLPASKKTKTGYSTDAETLQKLADKHPIIEEILEYRQVTKLKSTYADGLAKAADAEGRVHSMFNQTGTATGRLSSSEPNLQNIPVRTELGRIFRKYFVPKSEDHVLIDADYSQIELRILAHISGDENMINAFLSGEDIHTMTASRVFEVPPEEVTPELRKRAKAVNFGILYGMGEYSLSEDLGISIAQAKKYIQSYLAGFPAISAYLDGIKEQARRDGFVTTMLGRQRRIAELSSSNKNLQHFGERVAMNSPIQGSAADIIKIAMIKVSDALRESGIDARLILQVHDELLIEAHKDVADKAYEILVSSMEGCMPLSVPLDVDAHIGSTWFDAK